MAAETIRTAWVGLTSHRMRTGLTVLGITIGIASVIVLIAVGKGSSNAVQESIDALGSNTLTVLATPGAATAGAASVSVTLSEEDAEALEDPAKAPAIKSVSPVLNASGTELVYESSTTNRANSSAPRPLMRRPATTKSNRARSLPRRR